MLHLVDHPLIAEELTKLRDPACPSPEFRQGFRRIASLMVPAVTANLETTVVACNTPLEITSGVKVSRGLILVPILRAGLGFLDGFLDLLPQASVAHLGLARNERTLIPEPYYLKHPPVMGEQEIIILDPMLATGGSAIEAGQDVAEIVEAAVETGRVNRDVGVGIFQRGNSLRCRHQADEPDAPCAHFPQAADGLDGRSTGR